ncbi:S8 family serine peptidase [Thermodesulfobacteriota bacterium]
MKKVLISAILVISLLSIPVAEAFEIKIIEDRLSLHANEIPLQSILQRLVNQGVKVRIDPQINPKITGSFINRDIRQGLDSVLKSLDHVLVWKSIAGPFGSIIKLDEIHVFRPGKKGLIRPLIPTVGRSIDRDPQDGSTFIKNELLLRLKPGVTLSEFKRILEKLGGTVLDGNTAVGIYRILLPENSDIPTLIESISDHPGIAKAEPNYAYPIPTPYRNPSLSAASFPAFPNIHAPEGTAPVAIIDTGLAQGSGLEGYVLASLDILNPEKPLSDPLGHGTQMALIAAGIVKPYGARDTTGTFNPIIPIRAFDDSGYISNFDIIHSIDFAVKNGARVMSLSWGSEIRSDFLEDDLDYAASKGLIVVASAGNEPTGRRVYPAAFRSVIGVGALGPDGKPWENSNYGDFVMLRAPGFAWLPVGYKGEPGTYAGTSISTAFVANHIASFLSQKPDATINEILNYLASQ